MNDTKRQLTANADNLVYQLTGLNELQLRDMVDHCRAQSDAVSCSEGACAYLLLSTIYQNELWARYPQSRRIQNV